MVIAVAMLAVVPAWDVRAQEKSEAVLPGCGAGMPGDEGCSAVPDVSVAEAVEMLGHDDLAYRIDGTTLTIVARGDEAPYLCCTFQDEMVPIGKDATSSLWALSYHLPHLDESVISLFRMQDLAPVPPYLNYRGPNVPADAAMAGSLSGLETLQGHVEDVDIDSVNLGGHRTVSVYVPPSPPPPDGYPVVYMADNPVASLAPVAERLVAEGRMRPALLVGIANGGAARNREYIPGSTSYPLAYAHHDAFVLTEVMPMAEQRFHASHRREDRMTFGCSSGAVWALGFASDHGNLFAQASAFGVAGPAERDFGLRSDVTLYLGAGRYDTFFSQSLAFCDRARAAGATCHFTEAYTGHDPFLWSYGFLTAVTGAFPG